MTRHDGCVLLIIVKEGTRGQKKKDGINGVGVKWDLVESIIFLGFVGGSEELLKPVKKTTQLADDLFLEQNELLVGIKEELIHLSWLMCHG